jgi:hypothetical protein
MTRPDIFGTVDGIGRVLVYFDGEAKPRVDLAAKDFFDGSNAPFLSPMCGDEVVLSGGDSCQLRMPFARSVRVVTTAKAPYYDIGYETYPQGTKVTTFDPRSAATLAAARSRAALLGRAGGDPRILPPGRTISASAAIAPGERRVIFESRHAGTLSGIEITSDPHDDAALRSTWLEATWDGDSRPAVAAPLADLFLTGAGERSPALGLLAGYVPSEHRGYIYFPMPFARGARIELVNRGATDAFAHWRITTSSKRYSAVGSRTGELHATYLHGDATELGKDIVMLDAAGAGKVVGVSFTEEGAYYDGLTVFMEGDERVYLDGSRTPQMYGTGTEDFFGGAYYYDRGPFAAPDHGATAKQLADLRGLTSQYRLLLSDPWPFVDGVHLGIEHGAGDGMPTAFHSVVYWYAGRAPAVGPAVVTDYRASASAALRLTSFYEGDHDGNVSSPLYDNIVPGSQPPPAGTDPMDESVTASGLAHPPGSRIAFTVRLPRRNAGVILRRRLDQAAGDQAAEVRVDGRYAGTWKTPRTNAVKRWADSDFELPASLTYGHRAVHVMLRVLSPSGWTDFGYSARFIVQ